MPYNGSKKMFTGRAKPIRITSVRISESPAVLDIYSITPKMRTFYLTHICTLLLLHVSVYLQGELSVPY